MMLKKLFPFTFALFATSFIFGLFLIDKNMVHTEKLSDFNLSSEHIVCDVQETQSGAMTDYISGYCFDSVHLYDYYNFGFDSYGKGVYLNNELALVSGEKVIVLPSTPRLDSSLLQQDSAQNISETKEYSFFAGVDAKFFKCLIPQETYQIAFVHTSVDNEKFLVVTEDTWTK